MSSAQYAWAMPVAVAAAVFFVIAYLGNSITFSNRFASALASTFVFALVFGTLAYFQMAKLSVSLGRELVVVAKQANAVVPIVPYNPVTAAP